MHIHNTCVVGKNGLLVSVVGKNGLLVKKFMK